MEPSPVEIQEGNSCMKKIAIVILNWNGIGYLRMFLGTIIRFSLNDDTGVCVADNGSTDGSAEWVAESFSMVRLIRFDRNYGFAEGYNRALDQIDSEYVVLINSDIEVTEGWLDPLAAYMDANPRAAACQPKILSYYNRDFFEHAGAAGGFIDKYGYPFCRGRILDRAERDEGQYNNQSDIFWSSGACMIVRRDMWMRCGGFDSDFFAHMEEIDLCWRFSRAGYSIGFVPDSRVYHIGGGSLQYDSPFKIYLNFRNSLYLLYKNLPGNRLFLVMFIRKVMDGLAAAVFLVQGKFSFFSAVFRAHVSYYKSAAKLREKREAVMRLGDDHTDELIMNKSIVFEFYVRGIKTYSRLKPEIKK